MCEWLVNPELGDEWFPAKCKIVIDHTSDFDGGDVLRFSVDPPYWYRWREEPWYGLIRAVAKKGMGKWKTVVEVGERLWIVDA
jgi:hypothetical protein